METFTLRRATTDDIALIHNLADVVFRHTYRNILTPAQTDYMMEWMYSKESLHRQLEQDGHAYYIGSIDDEPVGYVSVQPQEADDDGTPVWHLQKLYVLPGLQKSGIGRRLFDCALDHVRTQSGSPSRVELNVNRDNPAVTFYEHMGMRKLRQGDFPIGNDYYMNDYIMGIEI